MEVASSIQIARLAKSFRMANALAQLEVIFISNIVQCVFGIIVHDALNLNV